MKVDPRVGRRVRLVSCADPYTSNPRGLEGTVTLIDDTGTIHVRWDNGSTLGLIPGVDRWEDITKTIDFACPNCGAKAGERCSDAGIFVRDTAFHPERQKGGR